MINPGDVVYFQVVKKSAGRKAPQFKLQGHGFGIFLGHVPPFQKDPPAHFIYSKIGAIGYISFDDVLEFLGQESLDTCMKKYEEKYAGPLPHPDQAQLPLSEGPALQALDGGEEPAIDLEPSNIVNMGGLVDHRGKPLTTEH